MDEYEIDRNDAAMKQFNSRCLCTRAHAKPYAQMQASSASEAIRWGAHIDGGRWIHVGVSPKMTTTNQSGLRRTVQNNMKESFTGGNYA